MWEKIYMFDVKYSKKYVIEKAKRVIILCIFIFLNIFACTLCSKMFSKTCQTVYIQSLEPFLKFSNYNIFTWKIFSDLLSLAVLNVESIEKSSGFIRGWKEIGSRQAFRRHRFCVDVGTRARNPPVAELYPILAIKFVIRSAL